MRASPKVVTRRQLEEVLWPDEMPDSNSLKVHLYHLRQNIDKPFDKALIKTIQNQGFVIRDETEHE